MSGDADASTFGTGKVICTDDDNKCYLTYSDDRNYVISAGFNSEVTEKSPSVVRKKSVEEVGASSDDDSVGAQTDSPVGATSDGRDFDGQVIKKIGNDAVLRVRIPTRRSKLKPRAMTRADLQDTQQSAGAPAWAMPTTKREPCSVQSARFYPHCFPPTLRHRSCLR